MSDVLPFYVTGGTVPADSPSYIPRAADSELLAALTRGELCYVLNARQMGKSSLCVRTRQALQANGIRTAFLDLQKFGSSATAEQWYRALLEKVGNDLKLRVPFLTYWRDNPELPALNRLFGALRDVALEQTTEPIVVFLDEIDVVRDLGFKTDEFFGAIRQSFNARVEDPVFARLTFCIIGTVAPTDLIRDVRLSPFNIGTRIRLLDFTPEEATPLAGPLSGGSATLTKVLSWTNGHPYLTQRVCSELTTTGSADVDAAVSRLFFAKSDAEVDENVKNVRNAVLRGGDLGVDRTDLLMRYGLIVAGKRVIDDDTDPVCTALRLSGLVRSESGLLKPRCRVYSTLFDKGWVSANLPDAEVRRQKAAVTKARWQVGSIAAMVLLMMGYLTNLAMQSARQAQASAKESLRAKREADTERTKAQTALLGEAKAKAVAQKNAVTAEKNAADALDALKREAEAKTAVEAALKGESAAKIAAQQSAVTSQRAQQLAQSQTVLAKANAENANWIAYIASANQAQRAIDEGQNEIAKGHIICYEAVCKSKSSS